MPVDGNELGLFREYTCKYLCDLVRLDGAQALMTYGSDFYQGYPALTVNRYGKGSAWYVAADAEQVFQEDFIAKLLEHEEICGAVPGEIPEGLEANDARDRGCALLHLSEFWHRSCDVAASGG